jgi:hypothetical protein
MMNFDNRKLSYVSVISYINADKWNVVIPAFVTTTIVEQKPA